MLRASAFRPFTEGRSKQESHSLKLFVLPPTLVHPLYNSDTSSCSKLCFELVDSHGVIERAVSAALGPRLH